MKFKKGALTLSMNAIVIIILAIVFLGLALAFVTGIFQTIGEEFEAGFDIVTKQKVEQLRASTKKFDLEAYTVDLRSDSRTIMFMLLRNPIDTAATWNITSIPSAIGAVNMCSFVDISYKELITLPGNSDLTPPLLIKTLKTGEEGSCAYLMNVDIGNDGSIDEALELTVNII